MRTLFVTAASSDVGMDYLHQKAEKYDHIIAHYRSDSQRLRELKENLGEKLTLLQADLSIEEDTRRLAEQVMTCEFLPTHLLHLPALPCKLDKFHKIEWTRFQQDLNVSLRSAVILFKPILLDMARKKYGKVVVMLTSYTEQSVPPKFLSSYITSKYALLGLMKALSAEYAEKGICINGLSPEMMETKFLNSIPTLVAEKNAMDNPRKSNLHTKDIIPFIDFLLSDEAGFLTGQNIAVTGGKS